MKKVFFVIIAFSLIMGCARRVSVPFGLIQNISRSNYPDANGVIVFDSTRVNLKSSGKATILQHRLVKILSTYGKKKFGELSVSYCTIYDTVMIIMARIITPEGKVIEVPKKKIRDIPMPAFGKFFLPNVRIKKLTFPGLDIGSSVEWIVKDELRNPPLENHFDDYDLFEGDEPIKEKVYILKAPLGMKIKWLVKNGKLTCIKERRRIHTLFGRLKRETVTYIWKATDVPKIIEEPMMPPTPDIATKLLISTVPDWQTWSRWYYKLSKPTFEIDSAIKDTIAKLIKDKKTEDERIKALYYFVAKRIRYVETTLTGRKGGMRPADAPVTFRRGYGVCRDKAALLVAMLRAIGVDAYIVLTNPVIKVDKELPVDQFNHAIVAIKRKDGSYYYLDPTAEEAREYLLPIEMNKAVLVATEKGEDLSLTPLLPPEKNLIEINIRSYLDKKGNLRSRIVLAPTGFFEFIFREMFKAMPSEQQKTFFESIIRGVSPKAKLTKFSTSDITDLYTPLKIELSYEVPGFATVKGKEMRFSLSGGTTVSSFSVSFSGGGMGGSPWALPKRKYPLNFFMTFLSLSTDTLDFPKGYRVEILPKNFKKGDDFFTSLKEIKEEKGRLITKGRFAIKNPLIPVDEYKKLRSVMEEIERLSKEEVVLKRR